MLRSIWYLSRIKRLLLAGIVFIITLIFLYVYRTQGKNEIDLRVLYLEFPAALISARNALLRARDSPEYKLFKKQKMKDGFDDLVTTGDFASHKELKSFVSANFPDIEFYSEEDHLNVAKSNRKYSNEPIKGFRVRSSDLTIVVDPLDATKEFSENLTEYVSIMACVFYQNTPIMGYILPIKGKKIYSSWISHSHNMELFVPEHSVIPNKNTIVISRSHTGKLEEFLTERIRGKNAEIRKAAGAGYKALSVLKGENDLYVHTGCTKIWDICAPSVISKQTELAAFANLEGNPINFDLENPEICEGFYISRNAEFLKSVEPLK